MWLKKWLAERRLNRQIANLSEKQRQEILQQSPLEAGAFQGEGFHIFRKNEPDFNKAYVTSLGEVSGQMAEDWIIRQYLQNSTDDSLYSQP
ncbi:hypothetical protein IC229_20050 [Spirosoma sp. BT702]|uniref:Uncharacterized protein n=1 Tax=Spirosoma profusum TaxID=2771354 RepID=A0A926Y494_9BACT|nr:hypothetical protein [Spirosoma profusum]MBD2702950.1 hypothetical protein [Spirosoma profusum]